MYKLVNFLEYDFEGAIYMLDKILEKYEELILKSLFD